MVSGTRCPYVSLCGCEVVRGAAAPKGPMTYAVFIAAGMWASRLGCRPWGWDLSLEARILASRPGFEPWDWHLSLGTGIWALRLDLSLKTGIWASRLGFEPGDWDLSLKTGIWALGLGFEQGGSTLKKKEEKEKFPPMWKHRSSAPSGPLPKKHNRLQENTNYDFFRSAIAAITGT